jgi:hypothetical protein
MTAMSTTSAKPHFNAKKLTMEQVRAIRKAVAKGASQTELGLMYGVSRIHINLIVHRRAWAWLPDEPVAVRKPRKGARQ